MSGFLDDMARCSALRVTQAKLIESLADLEQRAKAAPRSAPLRLSTAGFDVIAELKLRSPAAGAFAKPGDDWLKRVVDYARGGAAAVSVLTEPSRFDGSLEHLRQASAALAPVGVPTMRKDFLVDPYQVLEARAAGAGGVLVIVRMLSSALISELLEVASEHGMFVLLEAFDAADLGAVKDLLALRTGDHASRSNASRSNASRGNASQGNASQGNASQGNASRGNASRGNVSNADNILVGINCRDLQTLKVVPERFAALAPQLPVGWPAVAESGVASAADAMRMMRLGYRVALIGAALMSCDDPAQLLGEILATTRTVEN